MYLKTIRANCAKAEIGNDLFYILTVLDVTEEIEKEKQLNLQKELSQQNAKLASLGELAAGVGHEINNPLSIISGQLAIIQRELNSATEYPTVEERFVKIHKSVQRITNITKGLRTFARADSVENIYFNFSELTTETVNMLKEIFFKEGVEITSQVQPDIWTFANHGRLQQVIVNLLNNAKDALFSAKQKQINVSLEAINDIIYLKVEDSGCGIDAEIIEKIFEPFFTTKDVNKGTGIGLALVNSIIKEHSGKISVSSIVNQGTAFQIEIPIKKDISS